MERTRESWKGIIRELYESFERTDQEIFLLREIDQVIIGRSSTAGAMEELFSSSVRRLSRIYRLPSDAAVYVYVGDQLLLLGDGERPQGPETLDISETVKRMADTSASPAAVLGRARVADGIFDQLPIANTVLVQPVYTDSGRLLLILLFQDTEPVEGSTLADPDFLGSVNAIAGQLSIGYRHRRRFEREEQTRELWDLFLDADLAPTRCFRDLARMVPQAFPNFGPLRLQSQPQAQILMLDRNIDEDPHFMTIRGTTGEEPSITKIDISDSLCGMLVEQSVEDLPFFCDDPTKPTYRTRYKNYLGLDKVIRTEFAVRLMLPTPTPRVVGILNIESEAEHAFNVHHQAAILELASRIAPMVSVFEDRIDHNRLMHLSVSSATGTYLDSLAGIFRHGIASPLLALRTETTTAKKVIDGKLRRSVDASRGGSNDPAGLGDIVDKELDKLRAGLENLDAVHGQIKEFAAEFANGISGFGPMGRFDLRHLVEQTVSLAGRSRLAPSDANIRITIEGEPEAYAFCSRLFKQHMFSLLTNSIFSIQERANGRSPDGTVTVSIARNADPNDSQEVDLNRRWTIRVRDDGTGADGETLAKLRSFLPGSHFRPSVPGQGLGLVAVQRYMASIGGMIKLDSVLGDYFEVELLFDEYREDVHGPMSTHVEGAGNGT